MLRNHPLRYKLDWIRTCIQSVLPSYFGNGYEKQPVLDGRFCHILCAQDSVQKWLGPGSNTGTLEYKASMMTITTPSQARQNSRKPNQVWRLCHCFAGWRHSFRIYEQANQRQGCSKCNFKFSFQAKTRMCALGGQRGDVISGNGLCYPLKYTWQKIVPV